MGHDRGAKPNDCLGRFLMTKSGLFVQAQEVGSGWAWRSMRKELGIVLSIYARVSVLTTYCRPGLSTLLGGL
jgi:hypothetical protein